MSEPFQVSLSRASSGQSWGFRLQGGLDFPTPLSIQSVTPNSIADQCGLKAGDAILQISNRPSDELTHDQAKQEIMMAGESFTMVVKRGSMKIWQPKVTPMSELRGDPQQLPPGGEDQFIQRTSLAADKSQAPPDINFYNRSARPFGGFGGGVGSVPPPDSAKVPVVMNAQYNTPMGMYSTSSALEAFESQSASLVGEIEGLSVDDRNKQEEPETNNNKEPIVPTQKSTVTLEVSNHGHTSAHRPSSPAESDQIDSRPRGLSPSRLLAPDNQGNPRLRSASPTFLAVQELDSGRVSPDSRSAIFTEVKDGNEMRYHGYTDPGKQSRSFKMLQHDLTDSKGVNAPPQSTPSGMRSVRAPTGPPPNVQVQQAQHMTCKVCNSLIIGVFVKVKGEAMHAECYKCVRCGKSLKNQGFFTVEGQLHCEPCAKSVAQPPGQNMVATAVYR